MDDGARTHDNRNHNPGLYQLSYAHHKNGFISCCRGCCSAWRARQDYSALPAHLSNHPYWCGRFGVIILNYRIVNRLTAILVNGAPGRIRTCYPRFRRPMLYPNELRAHCSACKIGRGREIRTPDILLPKQARYQTALYPDMPNCVPLGKEAE